MARIMAKDSTRFMKNQLTLPLRSSTFQMAFSASCSWAKKPVADISRVTPPIMVAA